MVSLPRFWRLRASRLALMALAYVIVMLGQPARLPWLGLIASVCGYALFWKGLLAFEKASHRFWISTAWFTAVQMVQLSWMTADDYQGLFIWAVWLILVVICGLQFGVLSFFVRPVIRLTLLRTLCVPSLWVLMEWSRLYITAGYTWNPVGLALTGYLLPAQLVTVAGVYGLSFWVMLVNVLVLQLMVAPHEHKRWRWAGLMVAVPYLFGSAHLFVHQERMHRDSASPLAVILIQTGLGPAQTGSLGLRHPEAISPLLQWKRIVDMLSDYKTDSVDLVVLPEAAVPLDARYPGYYRVMAERVLGREMPVTDERASNCFFCQSVADVLNANVICGLNVLQGECAYNAALHFGPGADRTQMYGKQVLMPFAESIPYDWMRPISARYGIMDSYTPGPGPQVFDAPVPTGITICYEETFGELVRKSRQLGAEVLVSLSTDGWYPNSKLPEQHLSHGRLRALENGVPLLRSCHTGITAAIDSLGRTVAQVGDTRGRPNWLAQALCVEVPRYHYWTLYSHVGDGLIVGLSILLVVLTLRQPKSGSLP